MSSNTRTGALPIGFRRIGGPNKGLWQHPEPTVPFAREHDFACVDCLPDDHELAQALCDAGIPIGSVDLPRSTWAELLDADVEVRSRAVDTAAQHIARWATDYGVRHFFAVFRRGDASMPSAEGFEHLAHSLELLAEAFTSHQADLVLEGFPGAPGAICCTPGSMRRFFAACPQPCYGLNYDPSHLIRLGIDPIATLEEFIDRVFHVHAKDTEIMPERQYEFGYQTPPESDATAMFLGNHWRYCIPGHGCMRWTRAFELLREHRYQGYVSIELEDIHFFDDVEAQQAGLLAARDCLRTM